MKIIKHRDNQESLFKVKIQRDKSKMRKKKSILSTFKKIINPFLIIANKYLLKQSFQTKDIDKDKKLLMSLFYIRNSEIKVISKDQINSKNRIT
jgi:hypothetical protein